MAATATPALPADVVQPTGFLRTLLMMSQTAVAVLRPLFAEDGVTIYDFAWVSLNPAGQQMLGQPACPAESLLTLFPAARANEGFAKYCQAFATGELTRQQTNYQADGVDGYFLTVAQRYDNVLIVNFTDSNDQPRSAVEQALRQSQAAEQAAVAEAERQQALLYRVFEHAPAMICILQGPQHVFQFANAPYRALMGGRPLVGRPFAEALPELVGQGILEPLNEVYRTGESFFASEQPAQLDHDNTHPLELEQRYYNLVWQARRDLTGTIDGVLVFAFDVTGQVLARQQVEQLNRELETRVQQRTQAAEQALAEAERQRQRVTDLVAQSPAAMCVVGGPDFTYEAFNPLYAAMFGGRPQLGRPMGEVLPEVVNHPGFLAFRAVYEEGRTFRQQEVLVPLARPSDGVLEDHYFSYTQQPRYDSQGQIDGVFVFAVEVTDQVQARQQVQALNQALTTSNAELHEANSQLTRTNVDLDTFVYTASHDLKAPITNIESITLALRDTLPAEVQQDELVASLLDLLGQTTARFQFTIGQLTDLSKLQLAHAGPAEPVHLAAVVESVRLDLAPAIEAAAAQLTVEVAPELVVSFSPANLRSAIYNLLSNALKYRDPARPAQVRVHAFSAGPRVVLQVQDNGLGLNAHQQSRLFGLFQRLHTHVEGTGVGLYITKRLVENGGGTIVVESQVEVGTTFTLSFPA